ncbi:FG-GAP repeat protein [Marinicella meishanensis]|uniref:FG-GAP repeat protein n=1 Tax=Marinicella meishanensis TaxID=2873263 RepID=UPI001CC182B0|nr:FG-GAP repeat protein [Marinicella sp. NBU2979]
MKLTAKTNHLNPTFITKLALCWLLLLPPWIQPVLANQLFEGTLLPSGVGMSGRDSRFGHDVALDGNRLLVGAKDTADTGVAYVFENSGVTWEKTETLVPAGGSPNDQFGASVALWGDWALIGAPKFSGEALGSGAAMLYRKQGNRWLLHQQLLAPEPAELGDFGCAIHLQENMLLVAACQQQAVYVYLNQGGQWQHSQTLNQQGQNDLMSYGHSLGVSAGQLMVSALGPNWRGSVDVFQLNGSTWDASGTIESSNPVDYDTFGVNLSLSENWAMWQSHGFSMTTVEVYRFDGQSWVHHQSLVPDDNIHDFGFGAFVLVRDDEAFVGTCEKVVNGINRRATCRYRLINNQWQLVEKLIAENSPATEYFGGRMAANDDHWLMGVTDADDEGQNAGAAYVFESFGDDWVQPQKLTGGQGSPRASAGSSLALYGDRILFGAPYQDHGDKFGVGSAYVYRYDGSRWWPEQKLLSNDAADQDQFGTAVLLQDDWLMVGAPLQDQAPHYEAGSIYWFAKQGNQWQQSRRIQAPDPSQYKGFGRSLALGHGKLFVGAAGDNEAGVGAGAVYLLEMQQGLWRHSQKITPPRDADYQGFGWQLITAGDWLFVTARYDGLTDDSVGAVHVYHQDNLTTPLQTLLPSHPGGLSFGSGIGAIDSEVFIGLYLDAAIDSRYAVEVFQFDGQQWTFHQRLDPDLGTTGFPRFGQGISVHQDYALIGAPRAVVAGTETGLARLYRKQGAYWSEAMALTPTNGTAGDGFAGEVLLSADKMVVAATGDDFRGYNAGAVRVYRHDLIRQDGFDN